MSDHLFKATPKEAQLYMNVAKSWFDVAFPHLSVRNDYINVLAEYCANQDGATLTHYRDQTPNAGP